MALSRFTWGICLSLVAIAILYVSAGHIPQRQASFLGFLHYWYYDYFVYALVGGLGFLLLPHFSRQSLGDDGELLAFLLGSFALSGFVDFVAGKAVREVYPLFLAPVLRLALILVLTKALIRSREEYGLRRAVSLAFCAAISLIPALIPLLHYQLLWLASIPLFLAILTLTAILWRDRLGSLLPPLRG